MDGFVKLKLMIRQSEIHALFLLFCTFVCFFLFLFNSYSLFNCFTCLFVGLVITKQIGTGREANLLGLPSFKGKNIIVTGGNTGIGFETAKELAKKGANIFIACRNEQRAKNAVNELRKQTGLSDTIDYKILNLSSFKSIKNFANNWGNTPVDILINNAGIMQCPYYLSEDGYELQFATNHLGHFLLTNLLLPYFVEDGRVVNLTSLGHIYCSNPVNWRDLGNKETYDPSIAYGNSKLANIYFTKELQNRCKQLNKNISVFAVHPGVVRTELIRSYSIFAKIIIAPLLFIIAKTPKGGAQTSLYCATEPLNNLVQGGYYNNCFLGNPSNQAKDEGEAKKLWEISEEFCGIN